MNVGVDLETRPALSKPRSGRRAYRGFALLLFVAAIALIGPLLSGVRAR